MFTGIVEEIGKVESLTEFGDGIEFTFNAKRVLKDLAIDNSISVNGVCLTTVRKTRNSFSVQAVHETLRKTNLGDLNKGSIVNLERSVKLQDRLGGHLVQGHIDGTGKVTAIQTLQTSWLYTISFPQIFRKYLIPVGSISVDGVSLTVARLHKNEFTVAIIPFTFEHTVFQQYKKGSCVNLEFDIIGKYLESLLKNTKL
ncbi:MAG: riboflavin synthase [Bacteroidota bacterium]|nr:riboflavin synthase [Bacteroidota bacterium]